MWILAAVVIVVLAVICLSFWAAQKVAPYSVRGRVAMVTGGSMGIGLEIARQLYLEGARVIICARHEESLRKAVDDIRHTPSECGSVQYYVMDVADALSVNRVFQELAAKRESPEIVVCCAGLSYPARFTDIPSDVFQRLMQVNFFGCVNVVREALQPMIASRSGRFLLTSSLAATASVAGYTAYAPTKAAVRAFAQAMDMEHASMGVRFQVLVPPDVATPGLEEENKVKSEECRKISEMGGSRPFPAKAAAMAAVKAIHQYKFQCSVGFEGAMLIALTANMELPSSATELLIEFIASGVLRLVSAVYTKLHYGIVRKVRQGEHK